MPGSTIPNHQFFRDAVLAVSSSLDLSHALRALFDFASRHFPLEGLTLHKYERRMNSLRLLFLVTGNSYIFLDELIPLSSEGKKEVIATEDSRGVINASTVMGRPIAGEHNKALAKYLPFKDRAYLVIILSAKQKVIGHLCLMGRKPHCFNKEHEEKLELLGPPVSLAMMNLLQYHRTLELQKTLDAQRQQLLGEVSLLKDSSAIVGQQGLSNTIKMIRHLSGQDIPVLIHGETGTGKELIADAIQRVSRRASGPYIKVNCGAIPETLVDSEFFGYRKGAFTGANEDRAGRFEQANGGTLFLDEIGDLPLQLQVRLLRVLQNGVVERLGSSNPIPVDVRIIAATHKPLKTMLQKGTFREDLYYRLSAFPMTIPPLRERTEDLPVLIDHFLKKIAKELSLSQTPRLSRNTMEKLKAYTWPGNVRELQNLIERAVILSPDESLNLEKYLPQDPSWYLNTDNGSGYLERLVEKQVEAVLQKHLQTQTVKTEAFVDDDAPLQSLDEAMAAHIRKALSLCRGKIHGPGGTADLLKIHPSTLRKRMDKLRIVYGYKR